LFPFGRRKFEFELLPLLEHIKATRSHTKVVCSLRDILVSKRDQARYETRVVELVNEYFDLLLIHADPRFQRLEETFPRANELRCAVQYTGFVAGIVPRAVARLPHHHKPSPQSDKLATARGTVPQILVSIGGGRVGAELLDCAIEASKWLATQLPHRMQIFTGPYISDNEFAALQTKATTHIAVERYTTEFLAHLAASDLSISMAGYNTCMNLLATGTRAIVHPFTGNHNEEQTIRAEKLARLGLVEVIYARELLPQILAEKIVRQLNAKPAATPLLDLRGVEKTASLLSELVRSNRLLEVAA
jgi:predicted glycosyltransferase